MASNEDEYEVLDVAKVDELKGYFGRVMGDISKQSALKQVGVGSVTGVLSGWLAMKVGKVAAATIGTTVLLVQVAQHQGYIQINWDRVQKDIRKAEKQARREAERQYPGIISNAGRFVQENMFLAVGFGGGFLVGMAI